MKARNYKEKVTHGAKITTASRKAIDKLSLTRRTYVEARATGSNITQAAAEAGVSRRMGHNYETDADIQKAYRELIRQAMPAEEMVELIKGGAHATETVYSPDGKKKQEKPDWRARKPYIEMASEQGGYFEKKQQQNNTMISVHVEHVGAKGAGRTEPILTIATEAE